MREYRCANCSHRIVGVQTIGGATKYRHYAGDGTYADTSMECFFCECEEPELMSMEMAFNRQIH